MRSGIPARSIRGKLRCPKFKLKGSIGIETSAGAALSAERILRMELKPPMKLSLIVLLFAAASALKPTNLLGTPSTSGPRRRGSPTPSSASSFTGALLGAGLCAGDPGKAGLRRVVLERDDRRPGQSPRPTPSRPAPGPITRRCMARISPIRTSRRSSAPNCSTRITGPTSLRARARSMWC